MRFLCAVVEGLSVLAGCFVASRYLFMRKKSPEQKILSLTFVAMFSVAAVTLGGSSITFPVLAWTLRLVGAIEAAGAVQQQFGEKTL